MQPLNRLREKIVTDTTVYVGKDGNLLEPAAKNCRVVEINNPILTGTIILSHSVSEGWELRVAWLGGSISGPL